MNKKETREYLEELKATYAAAKSFADRRPRAAAASQDDLEALRQQIKTLQRYLANHSDDPDEGEEHVNESGDEDDDISDDTSDDGITSFHHCGNCGCNQPGVGVYQCTNCGKVFCGTCSIYLLNATSCPSCGRRGAYMGQIR